MPTLKDDYYILMTNQPEKVLWLPIQQKMLSSPYDSLPTEKILTLYNVIAPN